MLRLKTKYFVAVIMFAMFAIAVSGGCGGGGSSVAPSAYLDGTLHGEMASALGDYLDISGYDDAATDRMLIISRPDENAIDSATLKGAQATLEAGQPVALENVNETEINRFLGQIGMEPNFKLASSDVPVELFAVEKRDGNTFIFSTMNDDDEAVLSSDTKIEKSYVISGDENDPSSDVIISSKIVSADKPEPTDDKVVQSLRVQNFLMWAATGKERAAQLKTANAVGYDANDLQKMAAATVYDTDASHNGQSFTLRYTIYSCHSFNQDNDYFLISQSGQLNPSVLWKRTENGHIKYPYVYVPKVEGHMRRYLFKNYWEKNPDSAAPLVESSPKTANNVTTVTSGVSWSMGGNIGFSGLGATGGLSGGASFSSSESVNVSDCTVNNRSGSEKKQMASWEYILANPRNGKRNFYWTDLEDAPLLARSNFQPVNQWVWCVPRSFTENGGAPLNFKSEFTWTNGKSEGALNAFWIEKEPAEHKDWNNRSVSILVPVGKPPLVVLSSGQMDFTKNGESKTVELASAKDWTAASSQSWCSVQEQSGSKTSPDKQTLHITAGPNNTGANREAVVTISSTDGKHKATLKVFQSQY